MELTPNRQSFQSTLVSPPHPEFRKSFSRHQDPQQHSQVHQTWTSSLWVKQDGDLIDRPVDVDDECNALRADLAPKQPNSLDRRFDAIVGSLRAEFDRLLEENETLRHQVAESQSRKEIAVGAERDNGNRLPLVALAFRSQDREEHDKKDSIEADNKDSVEDDRLASNEDVDIEEYASEMGMNIFVGRWVDRRKGFFGGQPIQITVDSWAPDKVANPMQEGAEFTCKLVKPRELLLLERRANGQERRFHATCVPPTEAADEGDDLPKLVISLEGSHLSWVLHQSRRVSDRWFNAGAPVTSPTEEIGAHDTAQEVARKLAGNALHSWKFELFIGSVILANALLIGIQANYELTHAGRATPNWMRLLDLGFLIIYTSELILRLFTKGLGVMRDRMFQFDIFLVVVGIMGLALSFTEYDVQDFQKAMVLRLLRLTRLLRLFKMVAYFKVFWRLSMGLVTSLSTVLSTMAMMGFILYLFALVGIELISKDSHLLMTTKLEDEFDSLTANMLTLFRFVTMDSIAVVYQPLVEEKPWLLIFFVPLFMFLSITLLNLVTAVTVEVAFEMTKRDRDFKTADLQERLKAVKPAIEDWFLELDTDQRGALQLANFLSKKTVHLPIALESYITVNSVADLFEVLDVDGDGEVTKQEFVQGVLNFAECHAASTETVLLLKLMRMVRKLAQA